LPGKNTTKLEGMANFAALLDVWAQRLARLAREFGAGHAAVAPLPGACQHCHLQGLCRISQAETATDDDAASDTE